MKSHNNSLLINILLIINFNTIFAQNIIDKVDGFNKITIDVISAEHRKILDSLIIKDIDTIRSAKVDIEIPLIGNYLYAYPPYPIPAIDNVNSLIFWDTMVDINESDISVYDMNCNKICGKEKIFLNKQTDYCGIVTWNANSAIKGIYFIHIKHGTAAVIIKVMIE